MNVAAQSAADVPFVTLLVFIPIIGAILIGLLVPSRRGELAHVLGVGITLLNLGIVIWMLVAFDASSAKFQFVERASWIPRLGVGYLMGVDGISLFMLALTGFLFPLMLLGSYHIRRRLKHFTVLVLALEGVQMGVFGATDLFLFFIFWELTLVPVYFLIGYWGGPNRVRAAVKFFIFTAVGSAFLLAAIIATGVLADGPLSFNINEVIKTDFPIWTQRILFWGFTIGFLFKVPVVPVHTWLPDAHTQAPTAGSADLAGVLLKIGVFGLIRFSIPLFPRAAVEAVPILMTLGVVGIVYAALVAMRQDDAKRLVAYTSISHMGFVVMGLFALTTTGIQGSVFQMLAHGLTTAALFFLVGFFYDRRHSHEISAFGGGVRTVMPVYAGVFLFMAFASAGLPGLTNFVGEGLTLFGTFVGHRWWAIAAATGMILAAVYMLWLYQRLFNGELTVDENRGLKDLNIRELAVVVPIVLLVLGLGVYPKWVLERIEPSVNRIIAEVELKTKGTDQEYVQPAETAPGGIEVETAPLPAKGQVEAEEEASGVGPDPTGGETAIRTEDVAP